ncbi:uncharacterized protein BX663DRAFT_563403 [Cokeromyces recurvatus]|uniref:uncharacterized protein n=1 Tax=Cokeromyces recurvatus TaxID=90255 RepID=UPI00221E9E7C|nr:uncharacterized protein BX663DRAFT_563403 [Cokeromyces recurvatus]KAI7899935.1 hypothetical protein BX663DRAFT_563403 [Cokeromyces recurvatus]
MYTYSVSGTNLHKLKSLATYCKPNISSDHTHFQLMQYSPVSYPVLTPYDPVNGVKLNNTALAKTLPAPLDSLNTSTLRRRCHDFISRNFQLTLHQRHSKLLSVCLLSFFVSGSHPVITQSNKETQHQLHISQDVDDSISCLLNRLPSRPPKPLHTQAY